MKRLIPLFIALVTIGPALAGSPGSDLLVGDLKDRGSSPRPRPILADFSDAGVQVRGKITLTQSLRGLLGEYALQSRETASPRWRFAFDTGGDPQEIALILEEQAHLEPRRYIGSNDGLGLVRRADDVAAVIGVAFSF